MCGRSIGLSFLYVPVVELSLMFFAVSSTRFCLLCHEQFNGQCLSIISLLSFQFGCLRMLAESSLKNRTTYGRHHQALLTWPK